MHLLEHVIIDTAKAMPFIFIVYLVIEYFEHRSNTAISHTLMKAGRLGSVYGAFLGSIPQCGFSVIAADLFSKNAISIGTLIAIFVATSDEAVPIILSYPDKAYLALILIGIKLVIAIAFGMAIDCIYKGTPRYDICTKHEHHEHFHGNCESCEGGILRSALKHTLRIFIFILLANFVFTLAIEAVGEDALADYLLRNSLFQPFVAALIGLIPNCAASVLLTGSYLSGALSFGSLVAGLCSGAGVGVLLLFKRNRNLRQNLSILGVLYLIGTICGVIIEILM